MARQAGFLLPLSLPPTSPLLPGLTRHGTIVNSDNILPKTETREEEAGHTLLLPTWTLPCRAYLFVVGGASSARTRATLALPGAARVLCLFCLFSGVAWRDGVAFATVG